MLTSQSNPSESVKLGCPSNDEQTCVFAGKFLELFKAGGWSLQTDLVERVNLPKPLSGMGLFKHGRGTYDASRTYSSLWVQQTESLKTISSAFEKIGLGGEVQQQADQQLPDNVIGVYFGVEP